MIKRILDHRLAISIVFLVLVIVSLFLSGFVEVNNNLVEYLPKDSPSTVGLKKIDEIFGNVATSETRILAPDVTVEQALEIKKKLEAVEGVEEIKWLDDVADINTPLSFINSSLLDKWYKDGNALYVADFVDDKDLAEASIPKLREIVGEGGAIAGGLVNAIAVENTAGTEVTTMMIIIIPLILLVLIISSKSWFEPVLFLLVIGVAIVINIGTNAFLGSVSFITQATAAVLQLAVSMDYSIFLLHSFEDARGEGHEPKEAMAVALKRSFMPICASSMTTVLGFVALMLMRFLIGPDMGVVLAKGVFLSLICVTVLLPGLTLMFIKIIDKTKHRSFVPPFKKFSKLLIKVGIPVLIVVFLTLVPVFKAQQRNSFIYGMSAITSDETSEIGKDSKKIDQLYGVQNNFVLLVPEGEDLKEKAMAQDIENLPYITSVTSYVTSVGMEIPIESLDKKDVEQLRSMGYSLFVILVDAPEESAQGFKTVESCRAVAGEYYGDTYYLAGNGVNIYDMKEVVTSDNRIVTIVAMVGIAFVIMLSFKSLTIPFLLVLAIEFAVWTNLSIAYFAGEPMVYIGYMIISAMQLGATVDYAILYTNNYLDKRKTLPKWEAAWQAISTSIGSILTSALILFFAGIIVSMVSSNKIVADLGELIGRGAAISAGSVLLFLPTLLVLTDKLVKKTTWKMQVLEDKK